MSGWAMLSTSARRAGASFWNRVSGRWCCSARESGRRLFWRSCTRWQGALDTAGLVAARGSRPAASSICRRSPPPHARAHPRPQLCLLQQAGLARQDGRGFRRYRSPVAIGLRRGRHPARGGCLPLWANSLHGRHERGARSLGRGAGADSRRNLQRRLLDNSWCRRQAMEANHRRS